MRAPKTRRVRRSRPSWSVPSQCAGLTAMNRSRRLVWENPYGVIQSARTAAASMTSTIAPPSVPSGFFRSSWTQTSTYHARDVGRGSSAGFARAIDSWGEVSEGGRSPPPSLVADARIEIRIGEVDQEVEAHDHRRDDQVHRLDDRVIEPRERLKEEEADARQAEDRLDDHRAAEVERRLEADQADHGDQRVLERVAEDDRPLAETLRPRRADVLLTENVEERRAHDPHDGSRARHAEHERRDDHDLEVGERVGGERDVGPHGCPLEVDRREYDDEHREAEVW